MVKREKKKKVVMKKGLASVQDLCRRRDLTMVSPEAYSKPVDHLNLETLEQFGWIGLNDGDEKRSSLSCIVEDTLSLTVIKNH